jgi:hypothetical protein
MSKERELLRRALEHLDLAYKHGKDLDKDIRAFLAAEKEAEPITSRIEVIYGVIRDCREKEQSDLEIARQVVLLYGPPPNDAAEPEAEPKQSGFINIYKSEGGFRGGHVWATEKEADDNREKDWVYCARIGSAEPEAEPVGYVYTDFESGIKQGAIDDHSLANGTPLYTRPEPARKPMTEKEEDEAFNSASKYAAWLETENRMLRESRKPMTEEEIDEVASRLKDARMSWGFIEGIRFAEKHHGISGEDQ